MKEISDFPPHFPTGNCRKKQEYSHKNAEKFPQLNIKSKTPTANNQNVQPTKPDSGPYTVFLFRIRKTNPRTTAKSSLERRTSFNNFKQFY